VDGLVVVVDGFLGVTFKRQVMSLFFLNSPWIKVFVMVLESIPNSIWIGIHWLRHKMLRHKMLRHKM